MEISAFVGFVNEDEAEIGKGREECRTWTDDDKRLGRVRGIFRSVRSGFCCRIKDFEPSLTTLGHSLFGVNEDDAVAESLFKNFDQLTSEGDFWNEQNNRFLRFKGISGHFKVNISLSATSDASEKRGTSGGLLEAFEGSLLVGIELDKREFEGGWWSIIWSFEGATSSEPGGDEEVGASGEGGEIII